MTFTDKLSSRI